MVNNLFIDQLSQAQAILAAKFNSPLSLTNLNRLLIIRVLSREPHKEQSTYSWLRSNPTARLVA